MISNLKQLTFLVLLSMFAHSLSAQEVTTVLKGKVVGRNSKTLLLHKATDDIRAKHVVIPIINNEFEYKLTVPATEAYQLVFEDEWKNGAWKHVLFFPESGTIEFTLHSFDEFDKTEVKGGELNQLYKDYNLAYKQEHGEQLSTLYIEMRGLRSAGQDKSTRAAELESEIAQARKRAKAWRYRYIDSNSTLLSYYFLVEDLFRVDYTNDEIKSYHINLSQRFPSHPYTRLVNNKLESLQSIRVGGKYIDFTAPDVNGKTVMLSDELTGKFALIDLWASWCGPCIKTSRAMIPVYEEFKNRGFTVVGVARESKDTKAMVKVIQREKYPWMNLVELDDRNEIWHKYNLSFSGGGTVLVNRSGEIVAIDPTSEEVRAILEKELTK